MNNKELKKYILNNGGATLEVESLSIANLNDGYMVSIYGSESQFESIEELIKGIKQKRKDLKEAKIKGYFIGIWYYNGRYYLDTSRNIKDKRDAIKFGESQKQIAIFDLKNNKDIKLEYKKVKYYSLYKIIKDNNNEIIDEVIIKQVDDLKELEKILNIKSKSINKSISRGGIINDVFKVYRDTILVSELY